MKYYMWTQTKEEIWLKIAVTNNYEIIKEWFEKFILGDFFKKVVILDEDGQILNMKKIEDM